MVKKNAFYEFCLLLLEIFTAVLIAGILVPAFMMVLKGTITAGAIAVLVLLGGCALFGIGFFGFLTIMQFLRMINKANWEF